ncbi:hypothetical protein ACHAQD_009168 [Fusarium lateritium]
MEPLTINDISLLIQQKPTFAILAKILRCTVYDFEKFTAEPIYWTFVHEVLILHTTSVVVSLKVAKEWAHVTLGDMICESVESSDEGQNEVQPSESGPTFHGDDLIAL